MSRKKIKNNLPEEFSTDIEILNIKFTHTFLSLSLLTQEKYKSIEYLARLRLIKSNSKCKICGNEMRLVESKSLKIKFRWVCKRPCNGSRSIFCNYIFFEVKSRPEVYILFYIFGHLIVRKTKYAKNKI
jgi:hypothetical protein